MTQSTRLGSGGAKIVLTALPLVVLSGALARADEPRGGYQAGGDPRVAHPILEESIDPHLVAVPSDVNWQEVLHSQRVTGQFNTIEVDRENPSRIFVGTEESTVVRSEDNGVTWHETELRPFIVSTKTVQVATRPSLDGAIEEGLTTVLQPPGSLSLFEAPRLGLDSPLELEIFPDDITSEVDDNPPDRQNYQQLLQTSSIRALRYEPGGYADTFYYASDLLRRDTLLTRSVRGRKFETSPVRMVAFCPGNDFPILAATLDELYGSPDDGTSWIRLMAIPGNLKIHRVRCSVRNPRNVIVSTDFGLFYSVNGGVSFNQEFTGLPGEPSYAAGWGSAGEDGTEQALFGLDSILFRGVPGSQTGMKWVYPNFSNPDTAPWKRINAVEMTPDGEIWLATIDGVRRSKDNGDNWEIVEPYLFNGHNVQQVIAGGNEKGELRIAVFVEDCPEPPMRRNPICRNSFVYATDDRGKTWFPYFVGMSRRRVVWLASTPFEEGKPGKWWVATGGEVFSNTSGFDSQKHSPRLDREAQAWAAEQLRRNLPLAEVKERSLSHVRISPRDMNAMWARARSSGLIPDLRVLFTIEGLTTDTEAQIRQTVPFDQSAGRNPFEWNVFMQLRWYTFALAAYLSSSWDPDDQDGEENETRAELYELRRQVDFLVEDVWHERVTLLQRLSEGMTNRYQIAVTQERIDVLDLMLEYWMGAPLPSVNAKFWR
jgi:hypothetical protein